MAIGSGLVSRKYYPLDASFGQAVFRHGLPGLTCQILCGGFDPHPPSNNAGSQAQGVTSPVHGLMYRPFAVDVRCETTLNQVDVLPNGAMIEYSLPKLQASTPSTSHWICAGISSVLQYRPLHWRHATI